jgi:hypothetical protein
MASQLKPSARSERRNLNQVAPFCCRRAAQEAGFGHDKAITALGVFAAGKPPNIHDEKEPAN